MLDYLTLNIVLWSHERMVLPSFVHAIIHSLIVQQKSPCSKCTSCDHVKSTYRVHMNAVVLKVFHKSDSFQTQL